VTAGDARTTTVKDHGGVYHTDRHGSLTMCITACSINYDEEKRTEQNLILRSGKSEVQIRRIALAVLYTVETLKLTTDRHDASRGLFATSELLVFLENWHLKCRYD